MSIKRLEPEGAGGQPRGRGRWEQNLWYRSPCDRARAKSLEFYTDVTVLCLRNTCWGTREKSSVGENRHYLTVTLTVKEWVTDPLLALTVTA